ncbi:hypothetical protein GCM10010271_21980 [Streptomyces kurssanovii]|nr:hypothetical protein GCM10010271_21980 [Streptomyces kurssanovii]
MRRRIRAATALAALLALTGCGIQETDVIEAGGPATLDVLPAREHRMMAFFLSPDGLLVPSPRSVDTRVWDGAVGPESGTAPEPPSTAKTVAALLAGPNAAEKRAGLSNEPSLPDPSTVAGTEMSGGTARLTLDTPLTPLTEIARQQLVCTIAYAESDNGGVPVVLVGTDGARPAATCDNGARRPAPTVTPSETG